jgi:hypothetical protein
MAGLCVGALSVLLQLKTICNLLHDASKYLLLPCLILRAGVASYEYIAIQ